ncbi:MAG: type II toxin-antitoxin system RelE/ParE family toxin [Acidobacteriota bacterium]|nr:type II toxin-antitoxin system RelE/ParE family toxin [Acidobacteriota bacterium]
MTSNLLRFHPEAATELEAAVEWYATRSLRAGDEFVAEFDQAIDKILQSPTRWRRESGPWRRYVLHRFPFLILYREHSPGIEIVAVAHGRRRPGYWRQRIG